jgi:hypothetical protein
LSYVIVISDAAITAAFSAACADLAGCAAATVSVSAVTANTGIITRRLARGRESLSRMAISRFSRRVRCTIGSAAIAGGDAGMASAKSSSTRAYVEGRVPSAITASSQACSRAASACRAASHASG